MDSIVRFECDAPLGYLLPTVASLKIWMSGGEISSTRSAFLWSALVRLACSVQRRRQRSSGLYTRRLDREAGMNQQGKRGISNRIVDEQHY